MFLMFYMLMFLFIDLFIDFFMDLAGMFSCLVMPHDAYVELVNNFAMPLPIPMPQDVAGSDLHYMSFEEAVKHPFSDEHQPSLQSRRRDNNVVVGDVVLGSRESRSSETEQSQLTQGKFVRGVVTCRDCMKPRCLYSSTSPCRMKPASINGEPEPTSQAIRLCREYAMEKLAEAQVNALFVCGMQPFDGDDLMYGVIVTRDGLECHHAMEFEYYHVKIVASWFHANLCAYCAGSSGSDGVIDEDLTREWKSVLPVCPTCRADGALPLARTRRRNGAANERRVQRARHVASSTSVGASNGEDGPVVPANPV